jgi:hypothetical protein
VRVALDEDRVIELERDLLSPAVREDRGRLELLLHPDFVEVGASGRRWTRAAIIDELAATRAGPPVVEPLDVSDMAAHRVAPGAILVTFTTVRGGRRVHRSSLWVGGPDGWSVRFHQGTPVPET